MSSRNRFWKWLLRLGVILGLLAAGGWWFENWRGARAWEEAQSRAEKAGVSLVRVDRVGPEIPDDENLLQDPVFAAEYARTGDDRLQAWSELPVVDGNSRSTFLDPGSGETVDYRSFFDEDLSEEEARMRLAAAAQEVEARLDRLTAAILAKPVHLFFWAEQLDTGSPGLGDWIQASRKFSEALQDSALMAMRSGRATKALERIRALDRLGRAIRGPSLLGYLMSRALFAVEKGLIWEGLRLRVWNGDQLEQLSEMVARWEFEDSLLAVLRRELPVMLEVFDSPDSLMVSEPKAPFRKWIATGGPAGWHDLRKAFLVSGLLDLLEIAETRDFQRIAEFEARAEVSDWSPLAVVADAVLAPRLAQAGWSGATTQRIVLLALQAERQFLETGAYPESLGVLDPDFPVTDLTDPEDRELAYELGPEGRPQIWSRHQEEEGESDLRWQFWAE